jgi:hypothetical protein
VHHPSTRSVKLPADYELTIHVSPHDDGVDFAVVGDEHLIVARDLKQFCKLNCNGLMLALLTRTEVALAGEKDPQLQLLRIAISTVLQGMGQSPVSVPVDVVRH